MKCKNSFILLNLALLINIILLIVPVIEEQSQMEKNVQKVQKEISGSSTRRL